MIDKIRELVEPIAEGRSIEDDEGFESVCDYAAGNIDDAYELGRQAGSIDLARTITKLLNEGE